jgi:arylformamidase
VGDGIAINGIYDLEPIRLNYLHEKLGRDVAGAQRNSPPGICQRRPAS